MTPSLSWFEGFFFNFLIFNVFACLDFWQQRKKERERERERERDNIGITVSFLLFFFILLVTKQSVGFHSEGFVTWECYCWKVQVLGFLFEQPWNCCKSGLQLRMKFLFDWRLLLFGNAFFLCKNKFGSEKIWEK